MSRACEWVLPSTPMSRAGITAAAPTARRRLRAARFLIVGGRCAAKRSNMAGLPFFLVRALRTSGSTVFGGPADGHTYGPTGRPHNDPQEPRLTWTATDGERGLAWLPLVQVPSPPPRPRRGEMGTC